MIKDMAKEYKVTVKYQEFRKNAMASFNGSDLLYEPETAVKICDFYIPSETEQFACNDLFYIFNHVDEKFARVFPEAIPNFKKAGHTSMSVGDIIEFKDSGNVYVVASVGFKKVA